MYYVLNYYRDRKETKRGLHTHMIQVGMCYIRLAHLKAINKTYGLINFNFIIYHHLLNWNEFLEQTLYFEVDRLFVWSHSDLNNIAYSKNFFTKSCSNQ